MRSEQLTLFALFDAVATENPQAQALPAGGWSESRRPPKPSASGPAVGENPTATALHGRRQEAGDSPKDGSPVRVLARRVAAFLHAEPQTRIDNLRLDVFAREVFGSVVGHARDAYDAAEAGMNLHIAKLGIDVRNVKKTIERLLEITRRMPRQSRRDERQVELQQFSTPPAQAFVVVSAAAIRPGMSVLEPSAGTGNLAVLARMVGGLVESNEIDPRRSDLLTMQGFPVTAIDAERLDNLLDPDKTFDAIVMNPPFSATGGRVDGHNTKFGARHVEQALLRLKPGGRLVAVVGRGMAIDRVGFRSWWKRIEARYRVRANIGMDGSGYGKFGTSFGNQIVVIDHDGPTASENDVITGSELSPPAAYDLIQCLADEDIPARIERAARQANRNGKPRYDTGPATKRTDIGELVANTARPAAHIETGKVFSRYEVRKATVRGADKHPANVVESTTMASVEPPDITYKHHLPSELIVEGRVSDLQIEDTIYAGQATETMLPNGNRRGHWNGDGTGIGKGREIYAFIYDQFQQGRRKHVHISASHQLVADAERDRDAIGLPLPIIHQAKRKPTDAVATSQGVFFTTYTMLAEDFKQNRPRFKQLADWLGPNFDAARRRFALEGFYRNNRGGTVYATSAHRDDSLRQVVMMSVKRSTRIVVERHELDAKYTKIADDVAHKWWDETYANTPDTATEKFYVLSGAIIPIYDKIMGGQGIDNTKVARAILEDGEALVGFNLSPKDVGPVKQRLGIGNPLSDSTAEEILELVDAGGVIELDNGWRIALSIVSGESVVELVLNGVIGNKDEIRRYEFVDETIHYKRRWFARLDEAESVLTKLMARRTPVRDITFDQAA